MALICQSRVRDIITPEQVEEIAKSVPGNSFFDLRAKLLIRVFFDSAIRLAELRNLKLEDINLDTGTIKVMGKGSYERFAFIGFKCRKLLSVFLSKYRLKMSEKGYLFCPIDNPLSPLGKEFIQHTVQRLGRRIGIRLNCHLLRHSSSTHLAKHIPMGALQGILGHKDITTTAKYVHLANQVNELRDIYMKCAPGDSGS